MTTHVLTASEQRLLVALRNHRAGGLPRHFLTVGPTVDRRAAMRDLDAALDGLRAAGFAIRERRRRRTGEHVYLLEAEPAPPPALFAADVGRTCPASAVGEPS